MTLRRPCHSQSQCVFCRETLCICKGKRRHNRVTSTDSASYLDFTGPAYQTSSARSVDGAVTTMETQTVLMPPATNLEAAAAIASTSASSR